MDKPMLHMWMPNNIEHAPVSYPELKIYIRHGQLYMTNFFFFWSKLELGSFIIYFIFLWAESQSFEIAQTLKKVFVAFQQQTSNVSL